VLRMRNNSVRIWVGGRAVELLLGDKRAWRRAIMERMAEVRRRKEELLDV